MVTSESSEVAVLDADIQANKTLNRSGGWARKLKSTSLAAARLAQALSINRLFELIQ